MAGRLNARKVETLGAPGRYADGGNLYLLISPNGGKRWTFFYRLGKDAAGKPVRREMGLGGAGPNGVSLKDARDKAAEARRLLNAGTDPMSVMGTEARAKSERVVPTFGDFADDYIKAHAPKFRNAKHIAQWEMTLGDTYCRSIRSRPVDQIDTQAVLKVLQPIWQQVPETASRLRGRIENVLDAAKAMGLRTGENPARWRGHLKALLPARQKLTRGHHAAMPYHELPAFIAALRSRTALAALALEFCILTATRSGETLNATWDELDLDKALWAIAGARMKAGKEHRVPLSTRAVEILRGLPRIEGNPHVFPGSAKGRPLSGMAMTMQLRRMGRGDITVHGFRSAFSDWCSEETSFSGETREQALAHTIPNAVEAAYRRGSQFDKRKRLMQAWADFCEPRPSAKVVPIKARRA